MEPDHPIIILRLAFVFLCALPAVRELYQYINDPRYEPPAFFPAVMISPTVSGLFVY